MKKFLLLLCTLLVSVGAWATSYELVTSASQLVAGKNYIIADETSGDVNVISTGSNTNNRKTTTGSVSNSKIVATDAMMVFTLGGSSNAWTFTTTNYQGTDGYLYNDDTSNNRLKVGSNTTTNAFTISFANNAISSIKCNGNTSRGVMCFNGTLVACYASKSSSYKVPQLYVEVETGGSQGGGDESGDDGDDSGSIDGIWVKCSISDLTSSDVFVIVDANSEKAMTNNNGTSDAPAAASVTISSDGNTITGVTDIMKWNISGNGTNGYTIYPNGNTTTWLYCTNTNNGVRVGTNTNKIFNIENHSNGEPFLKHAGTSRYVGVYSAQDWRCYTSVNTNINATQTRFYKYTSNDGGSIEFKAHDSENVYYATFSSNKNVLIPGVLDDDNTVIDVFAVAVDNGSIVMTDFSTEFKSQNSNGDIFVPANTGVLVVASALDGDPTTKVTYTFTDETIGSYDAEFNNLYPASKDKAELSGCKFYMLAYGDEALTPSTLGFYWGADNGAAFKSREGSAYLAVPASSGARAGFSFEESTGIEAIETEATTTIYTLNGVKVNEPQKGLNIVNGKKIMVRE